jgi:hypothetical protein
MLSDSATRRPILDEVGTKQVSVQQTNWFALIAFTGIATIGAYSTRGWINSVLTHTPSDIDFESFVHILQSRGQEELAGLSPPKPELTLVIAARAAKKLRLAMLSNFNLPDGRRAVEVEDMLSLHSLSINSPRTLVAGESRAVSRQARSILRDLSRKDREFADVHSILSMLNRKAAAHPKFGNAISQGCYVHSILVDGTSRGVNLGGGLGTPDIFIGDFNLGKWAAEHLNPASGEDIRFGASGSKGAED